MTATINEIRDSLIDVFNKLKSGELDAKEAVEINNTAGKIISSAKVQLAYHALRGESPNIAFLASPDAMPAIGLQGNEQGLITSPFNWKNN